MSELVTVARPYAKAAFDFAVEQSNQDPKSTEKWQQMLTLAAQISSDNQMKSFLASDLKPLVLADLFISVCGEYIDTYGQNFIRIMAENKRLATLPKVLELYEQYLDEHNAIANVEITSAITLTEEQLKKISTAIEKRLSKRVKLNCIVDKSIISGLIIRNDDMVIDSSVKGRLERFSDALQS